ncbi:hypothetical protein AWC38_SpisGene22549 [Stylophora pistillata]|uniref:Ig-like domain-containing protein n=1 Tax=Stylophora pistillata TaxID=50429 RepID=A0A2B4R898_STYPI|nr:hypothetical protein AWC38_SpisGene22549 [Stylophora pistillata]
MLLYGHRVPFQLDTGATVDILPEESFEEVYGEDSLPLLDNTEVTLVMYNKTEGKPIGKKRVQVVNPRDGKKYSVKFVVIVGNGKPRLGLRASEQMQLISVVRQNIMALQAEEPSQSKTLLTTESILEEYADVSRGEGQLEGLWGWVRLEEASLPLNQESSWLISGKEMMEFFPDVMTGRKMRAQLVHHVVPYKALENFSKAFYGRTGVVPWLPKPKEDIKEKASKGSNVSFECAAKRFPLEVEWKVKKQNEDSVQACINGSGGHYKIHQDAFGPSILTLSGVDYTDRGFYYCCLPSNCSQNVEDKCQQFILGVRGEALRVLSSFYLLSTLYPNTDNI